MRVLIRWNYAVVPGQALPTRYCQCNQGTIKSQKWCKPCRIKEHLCVIKHVSMKRNFRSKIDPTKDANKPWEIISFSDSDYAGDPMNRRSLSGFILYVLGVLVSWWSKSQTVCCFPLSDWVNSLIWGCQGSFSSSVAKKHKDINPIMVRVDDVSTIFIVSSVITVMYQAHGH